MSNFKNIQPYKKEITNAINKIADFTKGMDLVSLIKDRKTYDATVMNLILIGELASKIPTEIRVQSTSIPWTEITGFRNRIAHDYFGVDPEVLWKTIREDLPKLKEEIQKLHE